MSEQQILITCPKCNGGIDDCVVRVVESRVVDYQVISEWGDVIGTEEIEREELNAAWYCTDCAESWGSN